MMLRGNASNMKGWLDADAAGSRSLSPPRPRPQPPKSKSSPSPSRSMRHRHRTAASGSVAASGSRDAGVLVLVAVFFFALLSWQQRGARGPFFFHQELVQQQMMMVKKKSLSLERGGRKAEEEKLKPRLEAKKATVAEKDGEKKSEDLIEDVDNDNNNQQPDNKCPYMRIKDMAGFERHPKAGNAKRRHIVDPPDDTKISLVCCQTTKGPWSIAVHHSWAPRGASRFVEMVDAGFFDDGGGGRVGVGGVVPLARCVTDFLCQFGLAGSRSRDYGTIPDDPGWLPAGMHNRKGKDGTTLRYRRGYLAYAGSGPNSRDMQLIVALSDSATLGGSASAPHEVPWGELVGVHSYDTLDRIFTGYGEQGPIQTLLVRDEGLVEAREKFPLLDWILSCEIVDEDGVEEDILLESAAGDDDVAGGDAKKKDAADDDDDVEDEDKEEVELEEDAMEGGGGESEDNDLEGEEVEFEEDGKGGGSGENSGNDEDDEGAVEEDEEEDSDDEAEGGDGGGNNGKSKDDDGEVVEEGFGEDVEEGGNGGRDSGNDRDDDDGVEEEEEEFEEEAEGGDGRESDGKNKNGDVVGGDIVDVPDELAFVDDDEEAKEER